MSPFRAFKSILSNDSDLDLLAQSMHLSPTPPRSAATSMSQLPARDRPPRRLITRRLDGVGDASVGALARVLSELRAKNVVVDSNLAARRIDLSQPLPLEPDAACDACVAALEASGLGFVDSGAFTRVIEVSGHA